MVAILRGGGIGRVVVMRLVVACWRLTGCFSMVAVRIAEFGVCVWLRRVARRVAVGIIIPRHRYDGRRRRHPRSHQRIGWRGPAPIRCGRRRRIFLARVLAHVLLPIIVGIQIARIAAPYIGERIVLSDQTRQLN